ncbi:MAG: fructosamine kinase family protein [Breznakibacter sp.]
MDKELKDELENVLGSRVIDCKPVSGGSISRTNKIVLQNTQPFFVKSDVPKPMLDAEAIGLAEIRRCGCIKVPEVIALGDSYLVMEWIEPGRRDRDFFRAFGRQLALMHKFVSDGFGFKSDNFIGSTAQLNMVQDNVLISDWASFYLNYRLLPQFNMAKDNGYIDSYMEKLFGRIVHILPDILHGCEEGPSLLHGDLWGGNFMVGACGEPVLIDPAVYYGHREADLAMTKLFGGFDPEFYLAYERQWPLGPGANKREPVYLLYHVLNHLNLFGTSYRWQVIELMEFYQ